MVTTQDFRKCIYIYNGKSFEAELINEKKHVLTV